jgi:hypothetical protein
MGSNTKPPDSQMSPARLTRDQVARRLGVHITTVRRLERAGKLKPTQNAHHVWLFDPDEVERLAETRTVGSPSGIVAARVFELLREGYELYEIVIALKLQPAVVRALYAEWQALQRPESMSPSAPAHGKGEDLPAGSSARPEGGALRPNARGPKR